MSYVPLAWDSEFFGFPIGRVESERPQFGAELAATVADADATGIRCLYLLCPVDADAALAAAIELGFGLYDVRLEFERSPLRGERSPGVRDAGPADAAALDPIARAQLRGTRFWNDPRFDRRRVADLYSEWLQRGMATASRRTLIAGEADGFITCGLDGDRGVGEIELIAVAPGAEGRGVGGELVAAADQLFAASGLDRATVVTQGRNLSAQRLYQRAGYRTSRVDLWLHRWAG